MTQDPIKLMVAELEHVLDMEVCYMNGQFMGRARDHEWKFSEWKQINDWHVQAAKRQLTRELAQTIINLSNNSLGAE